MANGKVPVELLGRIRIPKRHWHCTLAQIPDHCKHKPEILRWIGNIDANIANAHGLLLAGEFSRGKSGTASILLKAAAAHGYIGLWLRARDLPGYVIEKTWFDDDQLVIDRARTVPILVIDELQIRDQVAYSEQAVEMLVRQRIDDMRCTIITTNYSTDELKQKYPALTEAMREAVRPVIVAGHDFRAQRQEEMA